MEDIAQKLWYQTLDWSMIWACLGAVIALLLYMEVYGSNEIVKGKTGDAIRRPWIKPLYHLVSAYIVLAIAVEIGYDSLKNFLGLSLEAEGTLLHTLAVVSGLSGGYVVAKLIRLFQKLK